MFSAKGARVDAEIGVSVNVSKEKLRKTLLI